MEHIWAVCPAGDGADSLQPGTRYGTGNKNAPVTAKTETNAEAVQEAMEEAVEESVPEADTDSLIVSTTAELISSITPDAHIILKSGTYNFSALTEAEIAGAGAYVDPDLLKQGEFLFIMLPD